MSTTMCCNGLINTKWNNNNNNNPHHYYPPRRQHRSSLHRLVPPLPSRMRRLRQFHPFILFKPPRGPKYNDVEVCPNPMKPGRLSQRQDHPPRDSPRLVPLLNPLLYLLLSFSPKPPTMNCNKINNSNNNSNINRPRDVSRISSLRLWMN